MDNTLASQHAVCRLIVRYLTGFREDSTNIFSYLENRELCVCAYVGWFCKREENMSLVAGVGSSGTASPDGL